MPRRDMVATDGMKLTLGDTTITLYITPGHTLGTISTLIPVKDHGQSHLAAAWGGTAFNWVNGPANYITPDRPAKFWFDTYSKSAERFRDIASKAGADIIIANHTNFDGSKTKIPALAQRDRDPAESVRHRQGRRAPVPDDGRRVREGRVGDAAVSWRLSTVPEKSRSVQETRTGHRAFPFVIGVLRVSAFRSGRTRSVR